MGAEEKRPESIVVLTEAKLREIVGEVVREAVAAHKAADGYLDTEQAAAYLGTTVGSLRSAVTRGHIVPDHRGRRGGGMKGNRFTRETLDAYCKRRR